MSAPDPIAREIERAVASIGKMKSRQLMREMRDAADAKEKARKSDQRKRSELGWLVAKCGLVDWNRDEIAGMLLDGKRHAEESTTMRLAFRKRGQVFLSLSASDTVH